MPQRLVSRCGGCDKYEVCPHIVVQIHSFPAGVCQCALVAADLAEVHHHCATVGQPLFQTMLLLEYHSLYLQVLSYPIKR